MRVVILWGSVVSGVVGFLSSSVSLQVHHTDAATPMRMHGTHDEQSRESMRSSGSSSGAAQAQSGCPFC